MSYVGLHPLSHMIMPNFIVNILCFQNALKVHSKCLFKFQQYIFLLLIPEKFQLIRFYRYCQICKGRGNLQFKKWSKLFFFYLYWLYQLLKVHKLIAVIQVLDRKSVDCYLMFIHPSHLHKKQYRKIGIFVKFYRSYRRKIIAIYRRLQEFSSN